MRRTLRPSPRYFPGYAGNVQSAADFAKCGRERRMAILNSLTKLMEMVGESLNRAEQRLAHAAQAVERETTELNEEREFLAGIMASYITFSQVIAADAAQAIEARRAETGTGSVEDESAVGNADAPTPPGSQDTQ